MKRFIVTALVGPEDKPLFDLVIYGSDLSEAMADEDATTARIETRLQKRNLTMTDFAGFKLRRPPKVPGGGTPVEYVDKVRARR